MLERNIQNPVLVKFHDLAQTEKAEVVKLLLLIRKNINELN